MPTLSAANRWAMAKINVPLFSYLIENLKNGKGYSMAVMMDMVRQTIRDGLQEGYDDYVFPAPKSWRTIY
jgi:hypothetical protein